MLLIITGVVRDQRREDWAHTMSQCLSLSVLFTLIMLAVRQIISEIFRSAAFYLNLVEHNHRYRSVQPTD